MTTDKESFPCCCFLDPVKSCLEPASKAVVLSWNVLIAILTPCRSCFKLLVRHQQGSQRIREKSTQKTTEKLRNIAIYNPGWGCRKAQDLLGSDSVRNATICCIPRRTKPTGSSCTPAGDWRHNHFDLAFVFPGIDEIVLIQELWFSSVSRLKLHLCEQNHTRDQWDGKHLHRCYPGETHLSGHINDLT